MDLSTTYCGLKLKSPLMPGASPLVDDVDNVRRLEDAGASAIVMHSLFEEQIAREQLSYFMHTDMHGESFAEATSYFPAPSAFALGPEEYLEHLAKVKAAVSVPVIGSLNGTSKGGWLEFARLIQQAGADALELNIYHALADPDLSGEELERQAIDVVRTVKGSVRIPVTVKLSPFYSSFANFAQQVEQAGADGLVLFNRFYQPDIDPEELQVKRALFVSNPSELPLRLRWLAMLSGRVKASLAVTGGVHTGVDAIKCVMTGAHAIQVVSALLMRGVDYLKTLHEEMERWMEEHEWTSLEEMRGNLSLARCPDPQVYERANYMLILQSWRA
jgi:dihydroorotate dehydrogenase (fumarate)